MNIYEHSLDYWKQHLNEALDAKKKALIKLHSANKVIEETMKIIEEYERRNKQ